MDIHMNLQKLVDHLDAEYERRTCSNYLFWPDGLDGVYELEFGNGKESSS